MAPSNQNTALNNASAMRFDPLRGFGLLEANSWMTFARLGILYGVLTVLVLHQVLRPETIQFDRLWLAYALVAASFAVSLCLSAMPEHWLEQRWISTAQIGLDAVWISVWLYHCEEDSNPFVLFYLFQILVVSLVLYRRGSLIAAASSVASFGVVIALRGWSFSTWGAYSALFSGIALVGGYLSEELRRATESLKEKNKKIDRLVEFQERILADIPTGLLTIDAQNTVRFINPAAEQILECHAGDILGQPLETVLPDLMPFFSQIETSDDMVATGETKVTSYANAGQKSYFAQSKHRSGAVRLQQRVSLGERAGHRVLRGDVAELISDDDGSDAVETHAAIGRVLLFQDVTKISQLEEKLRQHEKLAAVGQLAAGIAHEIRNPLASMSASIEMLKDTLPSSQSDIENQKLMDIAIREIDRLNRLVSEFLDYVKPEKFTFEKVPLSELLGEIVGGVRQSLERGTIRPARNEHKVPKIEIVERYNVSALALGNSAKLRQVIWNLVVNAAQAMQQAGRIEVGCDFHEGENVSFWVEDQGQGMTEKTLAHLYEPFFTTKDKGTGLGLATAYKIVEAHHGEILVRSKVGQGTRFEIVLQSASQKS